MWPGDLAQQYLTYGAGTSPVRLWSSPPPGPEKVLQSLSPCPFHPCPCPPWPQPRAGIPPSLGQFPQVCNPLTSCLPLGSPLPALHPAFALLLRFPCVSALPGKLSSPAATSSSTRPCPPARPPMCVWPRLLSCGPHALPPPACSHALSVNTAPVPPPSVQPEGLLPLIHAPVRLRHAGFPGAAPSCPSSRPLTSCSLWFCCRLHQSFLRLSPGSSLGVRAQAEHPHLDPVTASLCL